MMDSKNFFDSVKQNWHARETSVCVGLDSEFARMPENIKASATVESDSIGTTLFGFNKEIIDATCDLVCCYKIQIAFYAAEGEGGLRGVTQTIQYVHTKYPAIPVILDAKRSDIGSVAQQYAVELFDVFDADGVTLSPLFGRDSCEPFLKRREKGLFFLCHTSNPGAAEFQELTVVAASGDDGGQLQQAPMPLYQFLAKTIAQQWNTQGNCGLVVGATYPSQLSRVRATVGDLVLLIPGVGSQMGDIKATVSAGKDSHGQGMIISASRSIIYASSKPNFAEAAREQTSRLRDQINSRV